MSTSEAEPLDDRDEFGPTRFGRGEGIVLLPAYVYGNHKARLPHELWYKAPSQRLKEKVPDLFKYQRDLLALLGCGEVSKVGEPTVKGRKGQPKPQKTPLLSNTPRTTPETAKYLPSRQHSAVVPLDDQDVFEPKRRPFLLDTEGNINFDTHYFMNRTPRRVLGPFIIETEA